MAISQHIETFAGLPVRPFDSEKGLGSVEFAPRLGVGWDEEGATLEAPLRALLGDSKAGEIRALVIGDWGDASAGTPAADVIDALTKAARKLKGLRALFLGEITDDESELSCIRVGDVTPLLVAFPALEELWVRGGSVALQRVEHANLTKLVFESGGLAPQVPLSLAYSSLPKLEHLELWLGSDQYGGTAEIEDLVPLLGSPLFPALRHLGLRNTVLADSIAQRLCKSAHLSRIVSLDLSLGTLSDEGLKSLLACERMARLSTLDIHHHYGSAEFVARLDKLVGKVIARGEAKPNVDSDARYIAHAL